LSGGVAVASGLVLSRPLEFDAAVLLSETLPWDADLPEDAGRLTGLTGVRGRDTDNRVIPADLVARIGTWLREESGATLTSAPTQGTGTASLPRRSPTSATSWAVALPATSWHGVA
jgi:phospholipase/carboxylesterase